MGRPQPLRRAEYLVWEREQPEKHIFWDGDIFAVAEKASATLTRSSPSIAMRTTLTLDDDLVDKLKALAARRRLSFKDVVDDAIRRSISTPERAARAPRPGKRPHSGPPPSTPGGANFSWFPELSWFNPLAG